MSTKVIRANHDEVLHHTSWQHYGVAEVINGFVDIGGVKVPHGYKEAHVYVQKYINHPDPSRIVANIGISESDELAQAELDQQNFDADHHPEGRKEYWRGQDVGKIAWPDGHLMTDAEFEAEWAEGGNE
jgi:hypothetical protein